MAKKLALIDPDLLTNLLTQLKTPTPQPPANPTVKAMVRLDSDMDRILESDSGDSRAKLSRYNTALQSYMAHSDKYKSTPTTPPVTIESKDSSQDSSQDSSRDSSQDTWSVEILTSIPKPYRTKAGLLLHHIKHNQSKVGWDSTGQITIHGSALPGTNIVDLVHDLVRPRKAAPPAGVYPAIAALKESNLPREAVGNKNRIHLFDAASQGLPVLPDVKTKRVVSTPLKRGRPLKRKRLGLTPISELAEPKRKRVVSTPRRTHQSTKATARRWIKFL